MTTRRKKTRVGAYAWVENEGKVLLVKQALGPNKGKWGLPGGGIDFGESPLAALKRELMEECSLDILSEQAKLEVVLSGKSVWTDDGVEEDLHWMGITFLVSLNSKNLKSIHFDGDSGSADCSEWVSKDVLNKENLSDLFIDWVSQNHLK